MDNMDNMNGVDNLNTNNNYNYNYYPNTNQSFNTNSEYTNQQNFSNSSYSNNTDEELLRAFIGKNYEKITTKTFNWAGFFFTSLYMFYRKMYLYGFLVIALTSVVSAIVKNGIITLLIGILVGFFVNKLYIYHAKQKINQIKIKNPQVDFIVLGNECVKKGGTSVGSIFIVLLMPVALIVISVFLMLFGMGNQLFNNPSNFNVTTNNVENTVKNNSNNNNNNSNSTKEGILAEDVKITGYSSFGSQATLYIEDLSGSNNYSYNAGNIDLIKALQDYSDYVKVNIYYTQNGNNRVINSLEIFVKSTNENISNIKSADELREKLGLYAEGTYTDTFTLTKVGMSGIGTKNNTLYVYQNYVFADSKNNEYEMKYIAVDKDMLVLTEGKKYTVTFEVEEGTFDYEYVIKEIK